MSIYDIIHPEGLWETDSNSWLSNILRFGCFEFMIPGQRQCVECTCWSPAWYDNDRKKLWYGCPSHPNYVIIESNFWDYPEIKNQKSDLEEWFCSQQPKLWARTINIKWVILEHWLCLDNLIQRMKMQLSCLKDTLYVQIWSQHFKTEAEITSFKLDWDTFDISFCAQPYYEDDTKYTLEDWTLTFNWNTWSFEVNNLWASTYPEIKVEIKDWRGWQLNIAYWDTELNIYWDFKTWNIVCIDWITWEAKNWETLLHYDGCFELIKNKVEYTFNVSFWELVIDPNFNQQTTYTDYDVLWPYNETYWDTTPWDDITFSFPVDVSNIECIQKVLMAGGADLMRWIGTTLDVTLNIYSDQLLTNLLDSASYLYTSPDPSTNWIAWYDFPVYFNSTDTSTYDVVYFEYVIDLTKAAGNLGNAYYYSLWQSSWFIPTNTVRVYHNINKDYCLCASWNRTQRRAFWPYTPWNTNSFQFWNTIQIWETINTPKNYFKKLSLYISKTIWYPDASVSLSVYQDSTKTNLVTSETIDLFQWVAYNQACFDFDDLISTPNASYFFEFTINSFWTPVSGQSFNIFKSRANDLWIDWVEITSYPENADWVYFDLQCTDVFSSTETFEVTQFCLNYWHKNRYV